MTTELDFMKMTKPQAELWEARFSAQKRMLEALNLDQTALFMDGTQDRRHVASLAEVADYSVRSIIEQINRWRATEPGCDITLEINSPGGYLFAGFALYDTIKEAMADGHHVTTVAYGYAASMGGILLQAGTERKMSPNAYLMIHEVSSGAIGKASEIMDEAELLGRMQKQALAILAERSNLTTARIKAKSARKDWWMNAEEALEYGFIDSIADPNAITVGVK